MNMIERVARAMAAANFESPDDNYIEQRRGRRFLVKVQAACTITRDNRAGINWSDLQLGII